MSRVTVLAAALAAIAIACGSGPAWAARANKPPSVTLTAPTDGQVFTAPAAITLSASATDANGVARVDFYRGSTLIGTDTTAPYSVDWVNVPVGNYSLTATATDTLGASSTSAAVSITVKAPVSSLITSPVNGAALYGSSVNIVGTFNGDPATTSVLIDNGNTTRMAVPSGNNFSASVPLLRGPNTITVVAARNDRTFDSYSISVTGNDPPYVAFRSPAAGTYDAPASLELEAEALSPGGSISRVEFLVDGALMGTDFTAPYQYSWVSPPAGSYVLTARAHDDNGVSTADSRSVTINVPNTPPNVVLTAPADGATFQAPASITLQASASDPDGSIARVEFLRDGALIGTDTTAPYSLTWSNVPAGTYSLAARAVDNRSGITTSAAVTVTVTPPNVAPTVTLDSPASGAEFTSPANILLTASAADSDGAIMWVEFYSGTTLLGTDSAAPYEFAWNAVLAGSYALRARAIDNIGAATDSSVATITVNDPPPNAPPTVSVSVPSGEFYAPATLTFAATAADGDGAVVRVDFYADGNLLGADDTAPYAFDWVDVPAGSYTITAVATDDAGGTGTSAPVSVMIKALALAITTPSDRVMLVGDHVIVSGAIDAPFNSGVSVNGAAAAILGDEFFANVPLTAGENVIDVVLTTPAGATLRNSVAVYSDGVPAFLDVVSTKLEGVTPFDTRITITNNREVAADVQVGQSSFTIPARGNAALDLALPRGAHTLQFDASNSAGESMSERFSIIVQDAAEMDQRFGVLWSGMNDALIAGNKELALRYISEPARGRYGDAFDLLIPDYEQIVASFSPMERVALTGTMAEYAVTRLRGNERHLYLIYFIRGPDGIWRLDSM
jgi:hypothetical protein